jgi:hypothetical protein
VAFLITSFAATMKWLSRANPHVVGERIIAADLLTIPVVIIVANGASAGAAYYSWDLLGLVSVVVASSTLLLRRATSDEPRPAVMPFTNLLQ